jgi:hypothetical protein
VIHGLSIEERYPTKAEDLAQVRQAAQALVADGSLLAEDLELVVSQASQRYELVLRHAEEPLLTGDETSRGRGGGGGVAMGCGAARHTHYLPTRRGPGHRDW